MVFFFSVNTYRCNSYIIIKKSSKKILEFFEYYLVSFIAYNLKAYGLNFENLKNHLKCIKLKIKFICNIRNGN